MTDRIKVMVVAAILFLVIVIPVARARPDIAGPLTLVVLTLLGGEIYTLPKNRP